MSSSTNSSDSFINVESFEVSHTTSGSAGDVSNSDHLVDRRSKGLSYEWVDPRVLNITTCFRDYNNINKFLSKVAFLKSDSPSDALMVDICGYTDRVCHGRENAPHDFFFVYNNIFSDLHITLPFDDFTMGVLRILNVAPTQLHPNFRAALQAFRILYDIFNIIPTPQSFLFYYNFRMSSPMSWLSLTSRSGSIRFTPFTISYKNLKEKYFKIFMESDGRGHRCQRWTRRFLLFFISSHISCLHGNW